MNNKSINKEQIQRIKHIKKLLRMPDEEFMDRINPKPDAFSGEYDDLPWQEFSEYENGNHKIPDRLFNRVLLLSYRNNLPISAQWLVFGDKSILASSP